MEGHPIVSIQSSQQYGTVIKASPTSATPTPPVLRSYWWRWGVLIIFALYQIISNWTWITFAPIADIMRCYYGITNDAVNTLSLASAILAFLLMLPASWMLIHFGIRFVLIVSSAATAMGVALRVGGAGSQYFSLLISGQVLSSFNGLASGSTTLLSETWFPSTERATATAICASVAPQVGVLLGYALSPTIVHSHYTEVVCPSNITSTPSPSPQQTIWEHTMYQQIFYYLLGQAILAIIALFITIRAFPEAPPTPPSLSRLLEKGSRVQQPLCQQLKKFMLSLVEFMRNKYFIMFVIAAGIHIGCSGTIGSLINEMVLPYFKGEQRMIAYLGITMKVSSIIGLLLVGRLLDWTKAFYFCWVAIYLITVLSLASFAVVVRFQHHTYPLYIAIAFMGASFSSFQVVALEYAVELTYPLPEGTSAGLLSLVAMAVVIILMVVFGRLSSTDHLFIGTWVIVGVLFLGLLVAVFVRPELKRVNIDSRNQQKTETIMKNSH